MRRYLFCLPLLCALTTCSTHNNRPRELARVSAEVAPAASFTASQEKRLKRYNLIRRRVTVALKLPENASTEDVRPYAARFLNLPAEATWEDILSQPLVQKFFNKHEKKREEFVKEFGLPPDTTWYKLGLTFEELRTKL